MKICDLYSALCERIPAELSAPWDNDGLMCSGDNEKEINKVLICLDVTDRVIDYAFDNGFDLIVSHHPMIFSPLKNINSASSVSRKVIKLIKSGISVMSFHTRLDSVSGGVNDALAEKLGVTATVPFGPQGEELGRVGMLKNDVSLTEFVDFVKVQLNCLRVNFVKNSDKVHKVALLGGEGKDFLKSAVLTGADTFITGNVGYNNIITADEIGINIIEAGHFETENPVCEKLKDIISSMDSSLAIEIINSNSIEIL